MMSIYRSYFPVTIQPTSLETIQISIFGREWKIMTEFSERNIEDCFFLCYDEPDICICVWHTIKAVQIAEQETK